MPVIGQISVGDGATFTPSVDNDGKLSWTNNKNLPNPATVDIAQAIIDAGTLAPTASPAFTGTPTAPTAASTEDSTQIATTEFVHDVADSYLPLSGGTMTGQIVSSYADVIAQSADTSYTTVMGGDSFSTGASLLLSGGNRSTNPGVFQLKARTDSITYKDLIGKADGTLTWGGYDVITSAGGTISGMITSKFTALNCSVNDSYVQINGGSGTTDGGTLIIFGKNDSRAGAFRLTANDGTNVVQLQGNANKSLTWNSQKVHNGNATSVWSSFTPNESQYGAVFVDVGFAVVCNYWIGANKARSAGDLLFTIDSDHLPAYDIRVPFTYDTGATVGVVKIEASTGKATVASISSTTAQGRLTIGGFMWVKGSSLW